MHRLRAGDTAEESHTKKETMKPIDIRYPSHRQLTKEFQDILSQDPYPKIKLGNTAISDSALQGLNHFGLVTHGFGTPAMNAALNAFQSYLTELLKYHEGSLTPAPNGRNSNGMKNGDAWFRTRYGSTTERHVRLQKLG